MLAAVAASTIAHLIFSAQLPESAKMAGMLAGVYIGTTGNMNAVGLALGVDQRTFIMLNTSDMILSIAYLAFLMTLAAPLLGKILPPFKHLKGVKPEDAEGWSSIVEEKLPPIPEMAMSLGLAVLIVAISAGGSQYLPKGARDGVTIMAITTLAIAASFIPRVRALRGTQYMGQFLLLIFFTSVGVSSNLGELIHSSPRVFIFTTVVIVLSILIHFTLCFFFKIDRDTAIITSTATIFSPPFVPAIALTLKNKEVLVSGIASGLVGCALANYVGVALAWVLGKI